MRVYLDLCAIQRPLDDPSQLRVHLEAEAVLGVLAAANAGLLELVASDMHYVETARNPHSDRRDYAFSVLALAAETTPLSEDVTSRADGYVEGGIDAADALHLAAAVEMGAAYFCTTDDALLKRARSGDTRRTKVVTPLELAAVLEDL